MGLSPPFRKVEFTSKRFSNVNSRRSVKIPVTGPKAHKATGNKETIKKQGIHCVRFSSLHSDSKQFAFVHSLSAISAIFVIGVLLGPRGCVLTET
jgi:hypothetical protein